MTLFHRDLGGEGLPPLVILHGMLGSSRNWQTAGRDLASSNHVFALDARNHGQSPHDDAMTYDAMATDTLAWLDAQGLSRVTLMGHSMGGKTAMLLACRHPERVAQLIVVDIGPKDYHWGSRPAEFDAMNALDVASLKSRTEAEKFMEGSVKDWVMRKFFATNLERLDDGRWRWVINLPALTAAIHTLEKNQLGPDDQFLGPTQFVIGAKSAYTSPEDHALIRRHFPSVQIDTLASSGHNPHMEVRDEFVTITQSFLSTARG